MIHIVSHNVERWALRPVNYLPCKTLRQDVREQRSQGSLCGIQINHLGILTCLGFSLYRLQ